MSRLKNEFDQVVAELEEKGNFAQVIERGAEGEWLGMVYEKDLSFEDEREQRHFARCVFSGGEQLQHQNKIYCGTDAFEAMKKTCGILYGNEFSFKSVVFALDSILAPNQMLTLDKRIKAILIEFENIITA